MRLQKTTWLLLLSALLLSCNGRQTSANTEETEQQTVVEKPEKVKKIIPKQAFVRTPASVIDSLDTHHIAAQTKKGDSIVILDSTSTRYVVEYKGIHGYVMKPYLVDSLSDALVCYDDSIHSLVRNPYGAGEARGCDFFPREKPSRGNMPENVYALYLNIGAIHRIDSFIALAKQTKINAFVLDIKDNECPGYKAEAFEKYSPTHLKWAGNDREKYYEYAVHRMHEEGLYAIGRITVFKDSYFVKDNPDVAISDRATGQPFFHNNANWPSAFNRKVWQFNVELATEAIRRFGFDEINFDYVRFPDRMQSVADQVNYHNQYDETMVQAIQRFVQYATDEIHEAGALVSIDVFGESASRGFTTPYGQYWPALSNVADVICGMPYPDHFAAYTFGLRDPWNHPYHTLNSWGKRAMGRQDETATPAIVRTWVQAYHVLHYVDPHGIAYDAHNIAEEVRGLYDAGCNGGYITWLSTSSLQHYKEKQGAFKIDYAHPAVATNDSTNINNENHEETTANQP